MAATRHVAVLDARHQATPSGARQAFLLLRTVFTFAPIAFGLGNLFDNLTDRQPAVASKGELRCRPGGPW